MKRSLLFSVASLIFILAATVAHPQNQLSERGYYQFTVYHYDKAEQEKTLDAYLEKALVPALHRQGIKQVGIFKAMANDTAAMKSIYVLIPFKNLDSFLTLPEIFANDKNYNQAASEYHNAPYKNPAYARIETILLKAFSMSPHLEMPQLSSEKSARVYELRSYESPSEKFFYNKVKMFNEGDEIGLFKRLNFNAIFYAEVLAGSKMPNLMYMTSFENMEDRNLHWKTFVADPYWKELSAMAEYQNNVSHINIIFLRAAEYSDF